MKISMYITANMQKKSKKICEMMPVEEDLYDLAELFKIFGDSTRIRILSALFESELLRTGYFRIAEYDAKRNLTSAARIKTKAAW